MQCVSCTKDINPTWVHAIETNMCPFCGSNILEEHLKNLFSSLRTTMIQLEQYQTQLDDWMISNYNYIKTSSSSLSSYLSSEFLDNFKEQIKQEYKQEFSSEFKHKPEPKSKTTVKVTTEKGEEEVQSEQLQSPEETNSFFKRAEAFKTKDGFSNMAEKTQHLKSLVKKVKEESGENSLLMSDLNVQAENMDEYPSEPMDDLDIPPQLLNITASSSSSAKDIEKLKAQYYKQSRSKDNFNSGTGSFSRG